MWLTEYFLVLNLVHSSHVHDHLSVKQQLNFKTFVKWRWPIYFQCSRVHEYFKLTIPLYMNSSLKCLAWEIVDIISKIMKQCITSLRVRNSSYYYYINLDTCISNQNNGTMLVPLFIRSPILQWKSGISWERQFSSILFSECTSF